MRTKLGHLATPQSVWRLISCDAPPIAKIESDNSLEADGTVCKSNGRSSHTLSIDVLCLKMARFLWRTSGFSGIVPRTEAQLGESDVSRDMPNSSVSFATWLSVQVLTTMSSISLAQGCPL